MSGQSEEKYLPASQSKLRKERRKGKVATAPDLNASVGTIVGIIVVTTMLIFFFQQILRMFDSAVTATTLTWESGFVLASNAALYGYLMVVVPVAIFTVIAVVIANMIYIKGMLFSLDPIVPKFERLNPVEGFKRIFGKRGMIMAAEKLARIVLILVVLFGLIWFYKFEIFNAPLCGFDCSVQIANMVIIPFLIAACVLLCLAGLINMPIQQILFDKDMMMGRSEQKRDQRDNTGSPELKQERRRFYREIMSGEAPKQLKSDTQPTFLVLGDLTLIGMRYIKDEDLAPFVLWKAEGSEFQQRLAKYGRSLPVVSDPKLAAQLAKSKAGSRIENKLFKPVAEAMSRAGVISSGR